MADLPPPFALEPKDVKALLRLSSVEKAKALWRVKDFPGFEDEGKLLVDAEDLKTWWKGKKDAKLRERGLIETYAGGHAAQEEASQRGPEEAVRIQGGDPERGRIDFSKIVLFPDI